ncbi:MAG TPA: hypothetical protein VGZ22_22035, partial [Isosphaeraceae bacterium]|nr:hypothetical protein [Isosphaeraceae bacterium]
DFARFDCYACHHELRPKGWRPQRGFPGTPGRVPLPTWPDALVRLAIEVASPDAAQAQAERDRFVQQTGALHMAIAARQYGDASQAASAAAAIGSWSESLLKSLREVKPARIINRAMAEKLERRLCELAQEATPDYDSARQIAWAFRVIHRELNPLPGDDPEIESNMKALESALGLDLRGESLKPIEEALPDRLRRLADYEPREFQGRFKAIAERLAAPSSL